MADENDETIMLDTTRSNVRNKEFPLLTHIMKCGLSVYITMTTISNTDGQQK